MGLMSVTPVLRRQRHHLKRKAKLGYTVSLRPSRVTGRCTISQNKKRNTPNSVSSVYMYIQRIQEKGIFPSLFYGTSVVLVHMQRKEDCRSTFLKEKFVLYKKYYMPSSKVRSTPEEQSQVIIQTSGLQRTLQVTIIP